MAVFLKVNDATNQITGYQRSKSAIAPAVGARHVERTEVQMDEYFALRQQAADEQRNAYITEANGDLTLAPDTRPFINVTADKAEIDADGIDAVTLTVRLLNADGSPKTSFNGTVKAEIFGLFRVRFVFVSGVATKALRTTQSGIYVLQSTDDYRLKTDVMVEAFA